jgi:hypothetical protein
LASAALVASVVDASAATNSSSSRPDALSGAAIGVAAAAGGERDVPIVLRARRKHPPLNFAQEVGG